MSTFITRMDSSGDGPRVAVKDIIDVEGVPTTAGSRAVERTATPAEKDARCLAGFRSAGARLVGKANLHELAMLPFGTNPWFGSPVNPLDPARIPGGSSSGSAVAVAMGDADVALGSDTGGSVRVPAACCGITGLKTTHGRIPVEGVWPLAPSLDTIGPMATTVGGLELGMRLLEPGFTAASGPARTIGRLRTAAQPEIESAIDDALRAAEFEVVSIELDWDTGTNAFTTIYFSEAWAADHHLMEVDPDGLGEDIRQILGMAELFKPGLADAQTSLEAWRDGFYDLFNRVELLALPTLPILPPRVDELGGDPTGMAIELSKHTALFNAAGAPCTAQPVPMGGSAIPASVQLVGPRGSEDLLLATASRIEAAVA